MSAYTNKGEGQVIPLHPIDPNQNQAQSGLASAAATNAIQGVSSLPPPSTATRMIADIEAMLIRTRKLEAVLQQERSRARESTEAAQKLGRKLTAVQAEHSKLNTAFKKNLEHFKTNYSRFNQLKSAYICEKTRREQLEVQVNTYKAESEKYHNGQVELEKLRNELVQLQMIEKNLREEIRVYLEQSRALSEERIRLELDKKSILAESDQQKVVIEILRAQEKAMIAHFETLQSKHAAVQAEHTLIKEQNKRMLDRIEEFKEAVATFKNRDEELCQKLTLLQKQVDDSKENEIAESKELRKQLDDERFVSAQLEVQLNKQKLERDSALNLASESEKKLTKLVNELELSKESTHNPKNVQMLRLEF